MLYRLSDLLPYSINTPLKTVHEIRRVLNLLIFFCGELRASTTSFLNDEYEKFDAQVSENLCQIRAYQLFLLAKNTNSQDTLSLTRISQMIKRIRLNCSNTLTEYRCLPHSSNFRTKLKKNQLITVQSLLVSHRLDIQLNDITFFLVQTFILSRYKLTSNYDISLGIDYDKFCSELKISSKTFARKVIHRIQRNISEQSCHFIFKLLYKLDVSPSYIYMLNKLFKKDEVGRHVISCYEATKVILMHALKTDTYIQIVTYRLSETEKDILLFTLKPSVDENDFVLMNRDVNEKNNSKTAIIFKGIVRYNTPMIESKEDYIKRFVTSGLKNIILSNMAQHPQYAGLYLSELKYNPYTQVDRNNLSESTINDLVKLESQFLQHKYLSYKIGCTKDNPSLFLITHIFCHVLHKETETAKIEQSMLVL